ncbi:MAG: nucleotidyltransferase domain-containing protein [Candidatus Hinthialibacter antarcticus]|nr:nucleotidyltransferase domain-containing protein [Candidatus Hinthialibacter antarcticus]
MGIDEIIGDKRDEILKIAEKHGALNVRVFGSVARGEATEDSDIDFLVDLEKDRNLLDLGGLLMDLRDLMPMSVDVFTPNSLKAYIREEALRDAKPL